MKTPLYDGLCNVTHLNRLLKVPIGAVPAIDNFCAPGCLVSGGFGPMTMSVREKILPIFAKALDRKNLFSRLNAAVSKLSNLKRPV